MSVPYSVSLAAPVRNTLGEGCLWDSRTQTLFWVDVEGCSIHRLEPKTGTLERWVLPERVGSVALRAGTGLVAALESGFALIDLYPFAIHRLATPEADRPGNRFNDGRADHQGRFWSGTMDASMRTPSGALYRLNPDLSWARMEEGVHISNSICWSPDSRTMYFADSIARTIWAYDFHADTGAITGKRVFATTEKGVVPDGSTVDAQGYLWNAQWGGGRVRRYAPDGRAVMDVTVSAPQSSCCCFGGDDLATLYVTSAQVGMSPAALERAPQAGAVFAVAFDPALGIRGIPEGRFGI